MIVQSESTFCAVADPHVTAPVAISLLGCGTVGTGVVRLLNEKAHLYSHRAGRPVIVKHIAVQDIARARDPVIPADALTTDAQAAVDDPDVGIVVELMGGVEPARSLILRAIANGKHVVTANKELLAKHGREIFTAANERGVLIHYEGSVGGGIPLIMPLKRSLIANRVTALAGIVNGTTNYILTEMSQKGRDLPEVLAEAQSLGYAEADPTADLEGYDAAYKLAILASLIFEERISLEEIHREGISGVTATDIAYAHQFGYAIKLLAIARHEEGVLQARVHPTLIPLTHPLAAVNGVFNAVWVKGDAVGDVMLYGRGAGELPTASAVVGDILNVVADMDNLKPSRLMACQHTTTASISGIESSVSATYLRLRTEDRPGVLGQLGTALGAAGVSVSTLVQKHLDHGSSEIVLITHPVNEGAIAQAMAAIAALPAMQAICSRFRVEETLG